MSLCPCVLNAYVYTYAYVHVDVMYNTVCIDHPTAVLVHLIGRDVCKLHKLALGICRRAGGVVLSTCVCVSVGARTCVYESERNESSISVA